MTSTSVELPIIDLEAVAARIGSSTRHVEILWQRGQTLAFVARGRDYRSEFHINPSDEIVYVFRGELRLHYRTPSGEEDIAVVPEGSVNHIPSGTPHSPRFSEDSYIIVIERLRHAEEDDRFQWFCPSCDAFLHEVSCHISDYTTDPVGKAYRQFFDDVDARTCDSCGNVMPAS